MFRTSLVVLALCVVAACGKDAKEAAGEIEKAVVEASGPDVKEEFSEATGDIARLQVSQLARQAFGQWQVENRGAACPPSIDALVGFTNMRDANDPWGNPYKLLCGESAPRDARGGIGISSAGPDGKPGTDDDINSW